MDELKKGTPSEEQARRTEYKRLLNKTFEFYRNCEERQWTFIPTNDPERNRIQLHESIVTDDNNSMYLLRAQGVLKCQASCILTLNTDNSFVTRSQWDDEDLGAIRECQSFPAKDGTIRIVQSVLKIPSFLTYLGVQNRDFLGIQWSRYDEYSQTYLVLFHTVEHPLYSSNLNGRVAAKGMTILFIEERDNHECFVRVIAYIDPCGWLPAKVASFFKERLRDRLLLYERVCLMNFDLIYNTWLCPKCALQQSGQEPTCRTCQDQWNPRLNKERYELMKKYFNY